MEQGTPYPRYPLPGSLENPQAPTCCSQFPCCGNWPAVPGGSVKSEPVHIYMPPIDLCPLCMIMPLLPPQVCTQACLRSPRHSPRTWSYAHTQNPTSPCRHGRGPASCWHMHTHARTLTNILTCWCGYTPAPISMGSLSDSCQTAALLGICQVPLQAGENEGSAVAWASREER